jgi:hypothetical protein
VHEILNPEEQEGFGHSCIPFFYPASEKEEWGSRWSNTLTAQSWKSGAGSPPHPSPHHSFPVTLLYLE